MRLKQIKLAGFKSFVDPTQVPFPAAMTCVVGPNGCGKSNVIDAVRWVLGESSAKNLRGDAMTDVIFNGSTQRKPVSQASVELVFENTQGKLQGSLADRSEISLKRLVTRDAQSHYFLNGTKCRRRDITDIFLGTGLGPRSYAIIEQGMISKLIESKPQELRVFLEEAAGISKYKERRRETETRIKHTRDNLDRLSDVRQELGKNLDKLKRQAALAERYKELKATERRYKAELTCLKWLNYQQQLQQAEIQLAALAVEYAQLEAHGSGDFRTLTALRQQLEQTRDALALSQQRFYQLGADVTALEQQQLHQRQRQQGLADEQRNLSLHLQHSLDLIAQEEAQLIELQQQLLVLSPDTELRQLQLEELSEQLWQLEQQEIGLRQQEHGWQQQLFVLQQQHTQLQSQWQAQQQLRQQWWQRQQQLTEQFSLLDCSGLRQLRQQKLQDAAAAQLQLSVHQQQSVALAHTTEVLQQQLSTLKVQLAQTQVQHQQLQQQQLQLAQLHKQQLAQQPLLPTLQIELGWSVAVAVALGALNAAAHCQQHADDENEQAGNYIFSQGQETAAGANTLAAKIGQGPIPDYFQQIFCVDNHEAALTMLQALAAGQSVITQDGQWFGANWRQRADQAQVQNPQALAEQLQHMELQLLQLATEDAQLSAALASATSAWLQHQVLLQQDATELAEWQQQYHQAQTAAQLAEQQLQQAQLRSQQIEQELADCESQLTMAEQQMELWQSQQLEVDEQLLVHGEAQLPLQQQQRQLQQQLQQHKARQQQLQQLQQQDALSQVSLERQLEAAQRHLTRSQQQYLQQSERLQLLQAQLDLLDEPDGVGQAQLQQLWSEREQVAATRLSQQEQLQSLEQQVRQLEQGQQSVQQQLQVKQKQLESVRLEVEGYRLRANSMLELLTEQKVNFSQLQQQLPVDATESVWQQQLDKTAEAVQRLGPINLAAIEEYAQQDERKKYLDLQHDDLIAALDTLETAIRKIDRETRQKFKETFEQVNQGLQNLFPKVFGGGSAYLELTDDDLLETGVGIMARPPGKKNSTIHLLSGGEKALTALSLVFSIFRLNPAPFCMLDEVDAPLDDANVGRFCNLVREMSETVQFIYISHNKIAMEMAAQLMGVTMQEPGVSRVVAVDVQDAIKLAQA
jgi:chromosome segregation protein